MSCYTKEELDNMLEDVINELDLAESAIEYDEQGDVETAVLEREKLNLDMSNKSIIFVSIKN